MKMKRIYVAAPYTYGDVVVNVRAAVLCGTELMELGFTPFVPHLYHLWHTITPRGYEDWMTLCLSWLETCDAVLRLPGDSKGADREVARAGELGIPVFHDIRSLIEARHAVHPH